MIGDAYEVNFDGLIGPTHHYAGLSPGNLASQVHRDQPSNPKQAALQGLAKMKRLADLGVKQAVLPPHDRPDVASLRRLGFVGRDQAVIEQAHRHCPRLLAGVTSSSAMWAANAATVSPSSDTADERVHLTPANLVTMFHRSLEPVFTGMVLRTIFQDDTLFAHHDPLPGGWAIRDEGAANHTRLCDDYGQPGVEVFTYGESAFGGSIPQTHRYLARQTLEASQAIARLHRLTGTQAIFIQQNSAAIDAGVFHNDVIAVGNQNVLLYHSQAFAETSRAIARIARTYENTCSSPLICIEITPSQLSLEDAVGTYLFNSQLVTVPGGAMVLICPMECHEHPDTRCVLDQLLNADNPIEAVHPVELRQSMHNGGGPACLRLRLVLTEGQIDRVHPGIFLTDALYGRLCDWVTQHYRDRLHADDLADPNLLSETRAALDRLVQILGLGSIYSFQQ